MTDQLLTRPDFDPDRPFGTVRWPDGTLERVNRTAEELAAADALTAELDRQGTRNAWNPNASDDERARAMRANRAPRVLALAYAFRAARSRALMRWHSHRLTRARTLLHAAPGRSRRPRVRRPRGTRAKSRDPDPPHRQNSGGARPATATASPVRRGEARRSHNGTPASANLAGDGHPAATRRLQFTSGHAASATGSAYKRALDEFPTVCLLCGLRVVVGSFGVHRVGGYRRNGRRCLRERELVMAGWRRDSSGAWSS